MDPLAYLAAALGATGVGAILKIVLNFVRSSQAQSNEAMAETGERFDRAVDRLVEASERLGNRMIDEHRATRTLVKDRDVAVRDSHRRMAMALMQTKASSSQVGEALDQAISEWDERNQTDERPS